MKEIHRINFKWNKQQARSAEWLMILFDQRRTTQTPTPAFGGTSPLAPAPLRFAAQICDLCPNPRQARAGEKARGGYLLITEKTPSSNKQ
jgi:hypothetical protein